MVSKNGKHLQVLLDKDKEIRKMTQVRVDEDGKQLVVINKDGTEIMNYELSRNIT